MKLIERTAQYWKERFSQLEEARHRIAEEFDRRIRKAEAEATQQIQKDVALWYQRLADNNGISLSEARRFLKTSELEEFKWTLEDYIRAGRESNVDDKWAKELENASAKFHITRLEALKMEVENSVQQLYAKERDLTADMAQRSYLENYYRSVFEIQKGVGMGWNIAAIDRTALEAVIHRPWAADGLNFSERIWKNKDKLIRELDSLLTRNIMLGRPPGDAVKELAERMGRTEYESARLIYTESAYFGSISQDAAFTELGVEKFQFTATLDDRTSDICQDMDGQIFEQKDFQPGVNAPPMHPFCRSSTAPYYADMAGVGVRAARNPKTGKTEYIPRSMTYREWKAQYVDGDGGSELMKKVKATK